MRRQLALSLVTILLPLGLSAGDRVVPKQLATANFVRVTSYTGTEFDARSSPEDRAAIGALERAIQKWGRYKIVYTDEQADLIIAVRAGRLLNARGGVSVGNGPFPGGEVPGTRAPQPIGVGRSIGVEGGTPDDTMQVFNARAGLASAPIWWRTQQDGLLGSDPALFRAFRKDIEQIDKAEQKKQDKKKTP